jgi:hypothetical protein
MYQYQTSLQNKPPITPEMRALSGLVSPYDYQGTHGDVMRMKAGQIGADYNVAADQMNANYDITQRNAQNAMVLQGLNTLAQDRENQDRIAQGRLGMMRGLQAGVVGDLFR